MRLAESTQLGTRGNPARTDINYAFSTWGNFMSLLQQLGFALDATCPWRALGLDPSTATTATEALIDCRANRIKILLEEAERRMKDRAEER